MTPEQRLVVLENLLEKVRKAASERGLPLPRELPSGVWKERLEHKRLTAFSETGGGTHAPLALVDAPLSTQAFADALDEPPPTPTPDPVVAVSESLRPALIEFAAEFVDEVTSEADPEQIESLVLAQVQEQAREAALAEQAQDGANDMPAESMPFPLVTHHVVEPLQAPELKAPSSVRPASLPLSTSPARLTSSLPPVRRPSYAPRPSNPPLELDDLDDLVIPTAGPSSLPLAPALPKPPRLPLEERGPTMLERAFARSEEAPSAEEGGEEEEERKSEHEHEQVHEHEEESVEAAIVPTEPPLAEEPARESMLPTPVIDLDEDSVDVELEPAPESQRQKVDEERPIDDALEGVSEPPPESGEVESQRRGREPFESHVERALGAEPSAVIAEPVATDVGPQELVADQEDVEEDDSPTPRPMYDVTAEVRSLGDVDVVERPPSPLVEVATFRGSPHRQAWSFGELLDRALDLAGRQEP